MALHALSTTVLNSADIDLTSVFDTAVKSVQSDVLAYVGKALPVGLAIMGVFVAIKLGVKFFKSVAK